MGNNLSRYRKAKFYSQRTLGDAIGVGAQSVAGYERGRHLPHIDTVRKISEVLGVPVHDIFPELEDEDDQPKIEPPRHQPPQQYKSAVA
jgi:DNA-binding XRE family transcriptional regulator